MADKTDLSPEAELSSPSTETEPKTDYLSSYTQIESPTYDQSQMTDLSASGSDDEGPEMQEDDGEDRGETPRPLESALPELSSQIVEWSKERFESYESADNVIDELSHRSSTGEERKGEEAEERLPELGYVDEKILEDLELYSQKLAGNVSQIMGFIKMTSTEITGNTVKSIETLQRTQNDLGENVDGNIKLMYRVISQCEELDRSMAFAEELANKIRTIRQTVENFEKLLLQSQ